MEFSKCFNALALLACLVLVATALTSTNAAAQSSPDLPTLFHYDGSSFITLANLPNLSPTAQVTVMAWIKPDFSVSNIVDTVISKRDDCGFNRSYFLVVTKAGFNLPTGTIEWSASVAGDDVIGGTLFPNDGQFHHIAGTYDGTMMKLFLDGALIGQKQHSGPIPTTSDPPFIGKQSGCGDLTSADIDQIKFFSRALSDQEILSESSGFALLSGNNSFTGNQTVNGNVTASFFLGDGSGLTNLNPAQLASGTAAINISGTAASAVNATNAGNASNLGGVAASNYARLDIGNNLSGNQSVTGNVSASGNLSSGGSTTIGGGTPIVEHLSATFSPSFPALKPSTCLPANLGLTGASDGDTLALGVPNARTTGGGTILYFAWVNAANSVALLACNISASPQKTAGSGAIRVDLWKH